MTEEIKLIEAAKSGDREAFRALLSMHYDFIYKVSFKFCGNADDARNNAHDVCLKLADKITAFDMRSTFQTWLYTVIMNSFRDNYRREKVRNRYIGGEIPEDIILPELPETDRIVAKQIYALVLGLPPKLKQAFILVYMQDVSHAEAAEILKCSEGTVSWRIHEAKKIIRKALEKKGVKTVLKILPIIMVFLVTYLVCFTSLREGKADEAIDNCHSERSEESHLNKSEILGSAQDDKAGLPRFLWSLAIKNGIIPAKAGIYHNIINSDSSLRWNDAEKVNYIYG